MKVVEKIVEDLKNYLVDKKILEVACGDSNFSLCASQYAKEGVAIDISLERFKRRNIGIPQNLVFKEMDATQLSFDNQSFDVSISYNTLGHLDTILGSVLKEMNRVTNTYGYLIFIATWKMDKRMFPDLKNIIKEQNNLSIYADIENTKYHAIILKKENSLK